MARPPAVALVAILAALWLAMLLLGGPASGADAMLLRAFRHPGLVPAARRLTLLGNWDVLLPLTLVAAALLFFLASRRAALLYLVLILVGRLLVEGEKIAYPSGHAAYSMMAWLGLALLATRTTRRRGAAVALALALAFLVGSSRLVLAVHWPSDVIGGWAFGAAWTLLFLRLTEGTSPPLRH
jgi:membrane-associated phospholipid phosphatase